MSRLADPSLCPDCRSRVTASGTCSFCHLDLSGPRGAELFALLSSADLIVEEMRRTPVARPVAVPAVTPPVTQPEAQPVAQPATAPPPAGPPLDPEHATYPAPAPTAARRRRLPALSVPMILLAVGGLFVFVAAALFLALSWGSLPLAAKAAVALGVTASIAGIAVALTRRALRGSAETFWALTLALVALDVDAARRAGLPGLASLSGRTSATVIGVLLVGLGAGVALWSRRQPVRRLLLPEIGSGVGLLLVCASALWSGPLGDGPGPAVGAALMGAVALAARPRLRLLGYAAWTLSVVSWLILLGVGIERLLDVPSRAAYWSDLTGWPLLVAALLAAVVTALPRMLDPVRVIGAAAALSVGATLLVAPFDGGTTFFLLVALVGLAVAAVLRLAPRHWALGALLPGAVSLGGAALIVLVLPLALVGDVTARLTPWTTPATVAMRTASDSPSWLLVPLVLAGVAVAASALRLLEEPLRSAVARPGAAVLPGVAALTVVGWLSGAEAPLWAGVVVLALGAAACVAVTARTAGSSRVAAGVVATGLVVLALVLAVPSALLSAVLATVVTLTLGAAFGALDRHEPGSPALPAGAVPALLAGYAAYAWTRLLGLSDPATVSVLAAVGAALLIGAGIVSRHRVTRVSLEVSGVLVLLTAAGIAGSGSSLTLALGVLCTATALVSARYLVEHDRASWSPTLAVPAAIAVTGLSSGAAHAWTDLAGTSDLASAMVVTLIGCAFLLAAAQVCRHLPTRLAMELTASLAGLSGALITRTDGDLRLVAGALSTSLAASAARHLVDWDRRSPRPVAAALSGIVLTLATGLAVGSWSLAAGAPERVTTLLLVVTATAFLLGASWIARHLWSRLALEGSSVVVAGAALATAATRDDAWLVQGIFATALLVTAARYLLDSDHRAPAGQRETQKAVSVTAAVAAVGFAAYAVAAWSSLAGADTLVQALLLVLVATATGVPAHRLTRHPEPRVAMEGSALAVGIVALSVAGPTSTTAVWLVHGILATALLVTAARYLLDNDHRAPAEQSETQKAVSVGAAAAAVGAAAYAVVAWSSLAGADALVQALLLVLVATAAALPAHVLTRHQPPRVAMEVTAMLVGVVAAVRTTSTDDTALVLTLLGTTAAVLVLLRSDRQLVGFGAAAVLAASIVARTGGDLPGPLELYVLPGAALLLVSGARHAARDAEASTWMALGAGLAIALLPSLVLVLDEPLAWRTLILGAAALAALVGGAARHWQAPFLAGAGVLLVVALRFLGPLAAEAFDTAVGPWLVFGLVGVVLLAAGILWERTMQRARTASAYVAALR